MKKGFNKEDLARYPQSPGVYIMRDAQSAPLYVGKAKNLQARLRQYFQVGGDERAMIPHLIEKISTIETIVVSTEMEALLLEQSLIQRYLPPYNALLKDDKSSLVLKVDLSHDYPAVRFVRARGEDIRKKQKKQLFFGPFSSADVARKTLDEVGRFFQLRSCTDEEFKRRRSPCILYQMQRCLAPCVGLVSKERYQEELSQVIRFLQGNTKTVLASLKAEMEAAAEQLEFERAKVLYQAIQAIEKSTLKQQVVTLDGSCRDVWGYLKEGTTLGVSLLQFRFGVLHAHRYFSFENVWGDDLEAIESLLAQYYLNLPGEALLQELLVPILLSDSLVDLLNKHFNSSLNVLCPQRGDKRSLIEMAEENARAEMRKKILQKEVSLKLLDDLQKELHLKNFPEVIVCIDISHLGGEGTVGAVVVFEGGQLAPKKARSYVIKQDVQGDDLRAMEEVLVRHLTRAEREGTLGDLYLLDGGINQLRVAQSVVESLNLTGIEWAALCKEDARHDKGLSAEIIYRDVNTPGICLDRRSPLLFLLQRIRDETHRKAISLQKKQRKKSLLSNPLDAIAGIGEVTKKKLLRHFGSARAVKEAAESEILALSWLTKKQKDALISFRTSV